MQAVSVDEVPALLKRAQMICSSKYGHFVDFKQKNALSKTPISLPEDATIFKSKHPFGELIIINGGTDVETVAFIFDTEFLPKQ